MSELPPDPRLQAALRHAPDALVEAPPAIAARVLAEARRAVAPPPAQPWWNRWWQRAGTGWMPQGAFATLLLAGLITLLWRGDPPGPAVEAVPMAESPAPTPGPAAAPAGADVAAVASASPAPAEAARQAARSAKAADAVQAAKSAPAERRREAAPTVPPPPSAPPTLAAPAAPPAAPPPPPPAPATATAQAPAGAAMEAASPRPLPAPAAAAFNRAALAAPEPAPWGDPPGPADRLSTPALGGSADPAWLGALARSLEAPWQDTGSTPPGGEPTLLWEREGAPYGRLWIERRGARNWVVWCAPAQARCRQAPLRGEAPALPR